MIDPQLVNQTLVLTFEEMAFLDVASGGVEDPVPEEGPWLFLAYSRPRAGWLALFLPKPVKFAVAEAIYGADAGTVAPTQLDDSLLEVMNVLAGRLLTDHFGPSATYVMGLPTVLYDRPDALADPAQTFEFHVDENQVTLLWSEVAS